LGLPMCDIRTTDPPSDKILLMVRKAALIRVLSVTANVVLSRGTLKSTLTKTRLPLKLKSLTVFMAANVGLGWFLVCLFMDCGGYFCKIEP
jgi:hypothetical protein